MYENNYTRNAIKFYNKKKIQQKQETSENTVVFNFCEYYGFVQRRFKHDRQKYHPYKYKVRDVSYKL